MIYFDNAATTPPLPGLPAVFGNPSSPHGVGLQAERALRQSAKDLADLLGCQEEEVYFTSGGTESNNLAIGGALSSCYLQGGVILAAPGLHPSAIEPLRVFADEMRFSVETVPVESWPGYVGHYVCVMAVLSQVNHETGDICDTATVAAHVKNARPAVHIHVDGAQGFCKEALSLEHITSYAFSAHKIHGPGGVGGLFLRRGAKVKPRLYGGGQQRGLRPGTENVTGIAGLAHAAREAHANREAHAAHAAALKAILLELTRELPDVYENAAGPQTSPYILNLSFEGVKGHTLVNALSQQEIYVSMGAACRAKKHRPSPLAALGFDAGRVDSAVRFSFSHMNTPDEARQVKEAIRALVPTLRKTGARR